MAKSPSSSNALKGPVALSPAFGDSTGAASTALVAIGLSYRRTPLEVREQVAPSSIPRATGALGQYLPEGVLLATCNRVEAYTVATSVDEGVELLRSYLQANATVDLAPYLDVYTGEEAVRHLFRVAAGLDSLVLGEAEVLGQVRGALQAARDAKMAGREIVHIFEQAVGVGRRVRVETGINRHAGSISSVAVSLARRALKNLSGRRVLVVGAGEAAGLGARALVNAGASEMIVVNRTMERAVKLAKELGGRAAPWEELRSTLRGVDVLVTAATAPTHLLNTEDFRQALEGHGTGHILVLDIAVPRSVDPRAGEVPGVTLYNVDDLQAVVDAGMVRRRREIERVEAIIEEELAHFEEWHRMANVLPTVRALHRSGEDLRRRELQKALRLLPDLTPEERVVLETFSRSLVRKLLHDPVASLKDGAGDSVHPAAARRLFRLREEDAREPH